jgi:hypothetical protein
LLVRPQTSASVDECHGIPWTSFREDRIIVIPSICWIDRDEGQMTKIRSPFEFSGSKGLLDLLDFETTATGELCREAMLPDEGAVVRIGLEGHPENLDDAHGNPSETPSPAC